MGLLREPGEGITRRHIRSCPVRRRRCGRRERIELRPGFSASELIFGAKRWIGEDLVGGRDILEPGACILLVSVIAVRMPL